MNTALDLAVASVTRVLAGDRDGWLALWEEDGIMEDPVGPSPTCPDGKGHHGKAAITKFYDTVLAHFINPSVKMKFKILKSKVCGDEAAVNVLMYTEPSEGQPGISIDAINIYRRSKNGKLASLRSFWEFPPAP